jgi:hypothetical protein
MFASFSHYLLPITEQYVDAPKKKTWNCYCRSHGIILISFLLIIGIYVTYFVFDGFDDIYTKAAVLKILIKKN